MLRRGIALAITAGSLVLTSSQPTATRVVAPRGGDGGPPQHSIYPATSKESYLTQDQFDFVRPGYHIKINSVTIGADRKPVVDVTLTDDLGAPLDRLGDRRRRASARSASSSPGTTRPRATTPPTRPARRRARSRGTAVGRAGRRRLGRHDQGSRDRALHLHVRDGPPGRLRPDEDAHGRRLRPAHDARRHHGRQGLHRQRRVRLPSGRRSPSRRSGTRSRRGTPATSATIRSRPTAKCGRTSSSASSATRRRRPTPTPATPST